MNIQSRKDGLAHVVVLGNEKGGSGKSTTAIHIIIYLLHAGFRVLSIDADSRQQSLTTYISNRKRWKQRQNLDIPISDHVCIPILSNENRKEHEMLAFDAFSQAIKSAEGLYDYIIIDTPGFDSYLTRLAHSMADTLVTPINDSFVDLDVLGHIDPVTYEVNSVSHYAQTVQSSRKQRAQIDGSTIDWILVRNRLSSIGSKNLQKFNLAVTHLSKVVGCRIAQGISERVIFRSLFLNGMTVFDPFDESIIGMQPTMSHVTGRNEYRSLVEHLNLPINQERARVHDANKIWAQSANKPLLVDDIFSE